MSSKFYFQTMRIRHWRSRWRLCSKSEVVKWRNSPVRAMTLATMTTDQTMSATKRKRRRKRKSLKRIRTNMWTMKKENDGRSVWWDDAYISNWNFFPCFNSILSIIWQEEKRKKREREQNESEAVPATAVTTGVPVEPFTISKTMSIKVEVRDTNLTL